MSSFGQWGIPGNCQSIRGHLERQLTRLFDLLRNPDHTDDAGRFSGESCAEQPLRGPARWTCWWLQSSCALPAHELVKLRLVLFDALPQIRRFNYYKGIGCA